MYLMLNEKINNGEKINKSKVSDNVFSKINLKSFYATTLVESQTPVTTVSITGNISCDLLEGFDYTLTLYDYIYEIIGDGESYLIKKRLSESDYIEIFMDTLLQEDSRSRKIYAITELLNKKKIENYEDYSCLLENTKKIAANMGKEEYGYLYLLKLLDNKIPDEYPEKIECMEFLSECLINNMNNLGIITEEDKVFMKSFLGKYYEGKFDKSLLDFIEITDLPF